MVGRERGANDYSPLQFAVGFSILLRRTYGRIWVNEWMVQGLNGLSPLGCGLLGLGRQDFSPARGGLSASLSVRRRRISDGTAGLGTQLFCLLFRVLGTLCARLRAGSDSPGDTSGAAPVRSQVFERRLPPGPVAILKLTGLAVDAGILPLFLDRDETRVFALADIRICVPKRNVKGWFGRRLRGRDG